MWTLEVEEIEHQATKLALRTLAKLLTYINIVFVQMVLKHTYNADLYSINPSLNKDDVLIVEFNLLAVGLFEIVSTCALFFALKRVLSFDFIATIVNMLNWPRFRWILIGLACHFLHDSYYSVLTSHVHNLPFNK